MATRAWVPCLALSLTVILARSVSRAQTVPVVAASGQVPAGGVAGGSRVDDAQVHIASAMGFFRASDYTRALHEFELANAAVPSPELWYNIARAHELLHEYEAAAENCRRYLRDKVDPPDRAEVEAHIRELQALAAQQSLARRRQATGATLHVEVPLRGARIFLDEQLRGTSPTTATWPVEPGIHGVRVEANGRQSWRAEVRVHPGDTALVVANPARLTRYRTIARSHVASGILAGLGLAALGTGVAFGVTALAADCARCTDVTDASTRADVSFGVGAVLAVAATVVYFIERGASRTEVVQE